MNKYKRTGKRSGHCVKCGVFRECLHRDHIVPKWQDGTEDDSNIQYLCANCHENKSIAEVRTPEFAIWQALTNRLRWKDPVFRKKTLEAMRGVPKTEETKERMRKSAKEYRATPEGKADLKKAVHQRWLNGQSGEVRRRKGKKWTEETRAKYKESRSSPEYRAKLKAKLIEAHAKPSYRESMRVSQQARRALEQLLTPQQKLQKSIERSERKIAKLRLLAEQDKDVEALSIFDTSKTVVQ
jgi:hypothetical protein